MWPAPRLAAILLTVAAAAALLPGVDAAIAGTGSAMKVESNIQIISGGLGGGGHVTYTVSGAATGQIRVIVDSGYGNGDGQVSILEAQAFADRVDNNIEVSHPQYFGGDVTNTALLNKRVETDTTGLLGPAAGTGDIEMRYLLKANEIGRATRLDLADTVMVRAFMDAIGEASPDNDTFLGTITISHTTTMVGTIAFYEPQVDNGRLVRFRFPGAEVLQYDRQYSGSFPDTDLDRQPAPDYIRYAPFHPVESSLELFVFYLFASIAIIYVPRRFMLEYVKEKVGWLHKLGWTFVLVLSLIYFLGVPGLGTIVLAPVFAVTSVVLSYRIYAQDWLSEAKDRPIMRRRMEEAEARGRRQERLGAAEDVTPDDQESPGDGDWAEPATEVEEQPPVDEERGEEERTEEQEWPQEEYAPWPADVAPESVPPQPAAAYPPAVAGPSRPVVAAAPAEEYLPELEPEEAPPSSPTPPPPPPPPPAPMPRAPVARAPLPSIARLPVAAPPATGRQSPPARAVPPVQPATTAPGGGAGASKKVRCAKCRLIFTVTVVKRPMVITCPSCSFQGMLP